MFWPVCLLVFCLQNKDCNNQIINAVDSNPATSNDFLLWAIQYLGLDKKDFKTLQDKPELKRGNKRCSNAKILSLGYSFVFPDFQDGYTDLLTNYMGNK